MEGIKTFGELEIGDEISVFKGNNGTLVAKHDDFRITVRELVYDEVNDVTNDGELVELVYDEYTVFCETDEN